jgi:hypothetical protein
MFSISNTNWNCTYYYFECFMTFLDIAFIFIFLMKNLSKFETFSQQQPIFLNTIVDTIKQFLDFFFPSCMSFYVFSQNMCNTYSHNTTHFPLLQNQPLSFSIQHMAIFCIFVFTMSNWSPSLFKIPTNLPYYGMGFKWDFRLDSQLDPTYSS